MKKAEIWRVAIPEELGWVRVPEAVELITAIQDDALESAAKLFDCYVSVNPGKSTSELIRALKSRLPAEHKKCPCCKGHATLIKPVGRDVCWIGCIECGLRTADEATGDKSWAKWDLRSD
jgi:hypothetical protein